MSQQTFNRELMAFLHASPTPYHAVKTMRCTLEQHGFTPLSESDSWSLKKGGRYYVTRQDASIIAFCAGDANKGFRMMGAHTDSPCLKVKPKPEITRHGYLQLGVEVYGGVLLAPWFDRDLSLAGRVQYLDKAGNLKHQLINFEKPMAVIPSLAIHLDREANQKRSINPQTDIPPVICQLADKEKGDLRNLLKKRLAEEGCADCEEVLEYDLSFYDTNKPAVIGLRDEFIASARLDNLLSCFVGMNALIIHKNNDATALLVCNDHEEVGSKSATGAQGPFLKNVLERIAGHGEAMTRAMSHSMLISTDNAHAIHPNFSDRHDGNHGPVINKGTVIKINANLRYASNDETASLFGMLSREAAVPFQHFVTRTDMGCGSTIGPLTAGELGLRTLDVGLPTFGMHSIRELAGTQDAHDLVQVLKRFLAMETLPF
ncbi:M18 family aminopeptidase [Candidatus Sororendozoicomonas aggregata]|uniref:M18 family aminopeptidase n=1 Tax=Candidatus Sororendozoicomonas aggregata TaxID=3073239 RepID=UPI002ED45BCE